MAYYVIITRQLDRSIRDCGITPEDWRRIVGGEDSLHFVDDEREWHVAEHIGNGDGFWLDWGGIHCEEPRPATIELMINIARQIGGHIFDADGYIDPSWYGEQWWLENEREGLEFLLEFRKRHNREPRGEREIRKFMKQLDREMVAQAPNWMKIIKVDKR